MSFVWRQEHLNCAYFIACTCISEKIWLSLNIIESLLKIASFSIIIFILNFHTSCTLHHISVFNMQLYKDVTPMYTVLHPVMLNQAHPIAKYMCSLFHFQIILRHWVLPGDRKDYCVFIDLIGLSNWRIYK